MIIWPIARSLPVKLTPSAAPPKDLGVHMQLTYTSLRRLIAAVTLLFLLVLVGYHLSGVDPVGRASISAYYHHDNLGFRMRDLFIGCLTAVALMLVAYQGYTPQESRVLNAGGLLLLGVVAFPMEWPPTTTWHPQSGTVWVHYTCAVLFFFCLGYVSLFRARDTLRATTTLAARGHFVRLYKATGYLMGVVPALAFAVFLARVFGREVRAGVFWVEAAGVFAFLAFWVIKSYEIETSGLERLPGQVEKQAATIADTAAGRPPAESQS